MFSVYQHTQTNRTRKSMHDSRSTPVCAYPIVNAMSRATPVPSAVVIVTSMS